MAKISLPKYRLAFTAIELLLYIGLSSFILLVISGFFVLSMQAKVKTKSILEVEQQGQQVMQLMTQTIRNAVDITSPTQGNSAASLSLTMPSGNSTFDLLSGTIRVNEGDGATNITSPLVTASGLTFYNYSKTDTPGTIRITLILSYNSLSGRNEYDFSKTFTASATLRQ